MTQPGAAPRGKRTPVWWLIVAVAIVAAVMIVVPAYRNYYPNSAICKAVEETAGRDQLPEGCKTPTLQLVLGMVVVFAGLGIANKFGRRS